MTGLLGLAYFALSLLAAALMHRQAKRSGSNAQTWAIFTFLATPLALMCWVLAGSDATPRVPFALWAFGLAVIIAVGATLVPVSQVSLLDPWSGLDEYTWRAIGTGAPLWIAVTAVVAGRALYVGRVASLAALAVGTSLGTVALMPLGFPPAVGLSQGSFTIAAIVVAAVVVAAYGCFAAESLGRRRLLAWGVGLGVGVALLFGTNFVYGAIVVKDPQNLSYFVRNLGPGAVAVTSWSGADPLIVPCGEEVRVPASGIGHPPLPWRLHITNRETGFMVWDLQINDSAVAFEVRGGGVEPRVLVMPSPRPIAAHWVPGPTC